MPSKSETPTLCGEKFTGQEKGKYETTLAFMLVGSMNGKSLQEMEPMNDELDRQYK